MAALQQTGARAGRLRLAIEAVLRNSAGPRIGTDDVIPGPRIQQVFEWAAEEASQVDLAARILPCHLLLGILREQHGAAYETLHLRGVSLTETRVAVAWPLQSADKRGRTGAPLTVSHPPAAPASPGGYQVRRFSEPDAASAWLTELEQDGVILEFAGASHGAIWVVAHCKPGQ